MTSFLLWGAFLTLVLFLLILDLVILHKKDEAVDAKSALWWTAGWIVLSLAFTGVIYVIYENNWLEGNTTTGREAALLYVTGYVVEKSLSMDNLFVMAAIFRYFAIPGQYQHRVLYLGILGALVSRGVMILAGTALLDRFDWVIYIFAVFLLYSAYKMLRSFDAEIDPNNNRAVQLVRRFFPVSTTIESNSFFVKKGDVTAVTPLFIALVLIETTDIMFAFDSIPAIFAITTDPFIVFTSNIFAILGLRSLYFAIAAVMDRFHLLQYSLVGILFFLGAEMLLHEIIEIPAQLSLLVIVVALIVGVAASLWFTRKEETEEEATENVDKQ